MSPRLPQITQVYELFERSPFIAELAPGGSAVKSPVDSDPGTVQAAIPRPRFPFQFRQIGDLPFAEALSREQSDFNLSLIEPATVCGRVVHSEAVPDLVAELLAEQVGQRFAPMDVEIVHHQVNGPGRRVLERQMNSDLSELRSGVANVKWRPAFGSTAQKILAVPRRSNCPGEPRGPVWAVMRDGHRHAA